MVPAAPAEPTTTIELPDGRRLALDDVGDPSGRPVVYLHGTPDCRLARHPDDGLAAATGVRLLAVDRPGFGASDPDPVGGLAGLGHDLGHLAGQLGLDRLWLLGWSAGGLAALAAAGALGDRVAQVTVVGTLAPIEAAADPVVRAALGPARRRVVELASELLAEGIPPAELGEELAPHLVPDPITPDVALDHVLEHAGDLGRRELQAVPGAAGLLAAALVESVAGGRAGLAQDVARQLEAGLDLASVRAPVRSVHGEHDGISPPEVGRWLAARLPSCAVEVVPGAGHHLALTRWADLLTERPAGGPA